MIRRVLTEIFLVRSRSRSEARDQVRLYTTNEERNVYELQSDLYSIIKAMEMLEKAYVRDSITAADYTRHCSNLIARYKTSRPQTEALVPDVHRFMAEYKMDCPAAAHRLLVVGVPATTEHGGNDAAQAQASKYIAECVQYFITAMDSLKLNMVAVDNLHPLLTDVMDGLNRVPGIPADYDGKEKVKSWLVVLNKMKAHEELNEDQVRQMLFDLENAYSGFHRSLGSQ